MALRWSRIHAELGSAPGDLTYALVKKAVDEQVRESDDLDWKQALPVDIDKKRKEFAKDVAAMANTRGGLIVYGVREESERASELTPVSIVPAERERLRALAAGHIRPLVAGIDIVALNAESADQGLIVVSVPPSPDAPHIVGERNEMGVPFRHGPHTQWMSEHLIERAYRDRFARQADQRSVLTGLLTEAKVQLAADSSPWFMLAARPLTPLPSLVVRPHRDTVPATMEAALKTLAHIDPRGQSSQRVIQEFGNGVNNPKVGLRRWAIRYNHYDGPDSPSRIGLIELHHDGSCVVAIGVGEWATRAALEGSRPVPVRITEAAIIESLTVVFEHARGCGYDGTLQVVATLDTLSDESMTAVNDRVIGGGLTAGLAVVPTSRTLASFINVETEISIEAGAEVIRPTAVQIAEDIVNQFGIIQTSLTE